MAEIGLVASIFGVASFGTKVATGLYEAADIMIHARQQIASMAKHVSQFTAILRHLGRVLEAERGHCSKDLLREIRKIRRSCKATFKEINATVRSKTYRYLVPIRWLFKKAKAQELESRLDSEQSMLQVMIHTITVSKLGDMQSKSEEDSGHISGLKEEIQILKTLIIENNNNVTNLQHAEELTQAEDRQSSVPTGFTGGFPEAGASFSAQPSKSPPPDSSSSGSDNEDSESDQEDAPKVRDSALQPLSPESHVVGSGHSRTSELLLQMIPYKSDDSRMSYLKSSNRLISDRDQTMPGIEARPKPAIEEATQSVRLLLDKWTNSGSAPIADVLDAEDARNSRERDTPSRDSREWSSYERPGPSVPPQAWMGHDLGYEYGVPRPDPTYGYPQGGYIPPPLERRTGSHHAPPTENWRSGLGNPVSHMKDLWRRPNSNDRASVRNAGDDVLDALRYTHGGIIYVKVNEFQHLYFLDRMMFYRFNLAPEWLIPTGAMMNWSTEIGQGLVRREALDLLGYPWKELVRLSFQADARFLEDRSQILIDKRGWREKVNALNPPLYPEMPSEVPPRPHSRSRQYIMDPYPNPFFDVGHENYYYRHSTPPPRFDPNDLSTSSKNKETQSRPIESYFEENVQPAKPEVRFTLPHRDSQAPIRNEPLGQKKSSASNGKHDYQTALEKLEILKNKKEEAEKSGDTMTASDLTYYAIPEMEDRIAKLKRAEIDRVAKAATDKQNRPPHPEIESDSDSSGSAE
ncbi:hypothetical protein ACLMJK_002908 [Lecanora helva]